jgi:propanediol dehydratase small subunit
MADLTIHEVLADVEADAKRRAAEAARPRTFLERLDGYALDYVFDDPVAVEDLRIAAALLRVIIELERLGRLNEQP